MKRGDLVSNFGSGMVVDPHVVMQASKAVVINSQGTEDAIALLDMLGLIPPQPGNEVMELSKTKLKINRDTRRERTLKKLNATAEEIGEVDDE